MRLLRPLEGTVQSVRNFEYRSRKARFINWASNDAKGFLEELDRGTENLAERIIETTIAGKMKK